MISEGDPSRTTIFSPRMLKIPSTSREIPLFLFFNILFFLPFQGNSQTDNHEQTILLKLKQEWGNQSSIESWDPSVSGPHCNWTGVICVHDSVAGILLPNMNITGKIPPSICELQNLTYINLTLNYIPGEFPAVLYNCSKLEALDLSQNYFVGRIPIDIDRISTLRLLNLGANNFSGDIPSSIGRFPLLQSLSLFANLFNGSFPPEIGDLSNLEVLEMAYNQFEPSRIPDDFGRLKKLRYLWMTETNLIGEIPETIGDLADLEHLDLSLNNLIGEVPSNLFLLKNLTLLSLSGNILSGEIPRRIETSYLVNIDLSMNKLNGTIPEDFGKLQYLANLDLFANRLSGEIPSSIGRIPSLTGIKLFKNNLTGVLPPDFGLYSKLEGFEVSENQFTGNLPKNLCAGGALVGLVAFSNKLTGEFPSSIGSCNSLVMVQLFKNRFSGEIPAGFWKLENLSTVIIKDNSFSGELPDKLSWNLSRLEMSNNRFSGKIPSQINASTNLMVFEASNNAFSGELPLELTALPRLLSLLLDGNQLSGQIPTNLISWSSLNTLTLSRNQLSGEIPPAVGLLPNLIELDLSENQFSGAVPFEIGNLKLTFLNISSNRLTGKIPAQLENMAYDRSFLNNPGLCADNPVLNLGACFSESRDSKKLSSRFLAMILVLAGALFLFTLLFALIKIKDYRRRKQGRNLVTWKLTSFQRLDFTESYILSSLNENNVIGSGGSGKVYRVPIHRSDYCVAVKKIWTKGKLGQKLEKEFQAEVEILGIIRHSNIVKLLCCISSENSKLLVYEYMENRSLDRWLHVKKRGSLTSDSVRRSVLVWPRRWRIAVGAAQGLCYMHHSCSPPIIHRDVKSSNILLDSEFKPRIADFGLAKMLAAHGESDTMSVIAGSFGYMAPEYAHTTKVNEKIDVYSFGVVLLELATGREANDGDEHTCLADWAWRHVQEGHPIEGALDVEVKEQCHLDEMSLVFKLGLICTGTLPSTRPSMKEVLQILLKHDHKQDSGDKKTLTEHDVTPLLYASTNYLSSYRDNQLKESSEEDDDHDRLACNV